MASVTVTPWPSNQAPARDQKSAALSFSSSVRISEWASRLRSLTAEWMKL
jgi:hypothetical protein